MDVFNLVAKLTLDSGEYDKGIDSAKSKISEFSDALKSAAGGNLWQLLAGGITAKLAADAVVSTTKALIQVGKAAVNAYADYEQLTGGVETLFKESSDKVLEYANDAYKTAGLSANEYMETVTAFSASLLQSLGGDTDKAADIANQAIIDMSDNANKMGTDMQSIQNAYQGFAKANYTMLDNLKLGYGGTKTEMERLLADAEAISGIRYDISSYADVVEAIHVIQTEMDITGTTAKEASETISGSIAALKSAWQNLLSGLANPDADLGALIDKMVDAAETALDNLLPAVSKTISGIIELIIRAAPNLAKEIVRAAPEIIAGLVDAILENIWPLIETGTKIPIYLMEGIIKALPKLVEAGFNMVASLISGILGKDASNSIKDAGKSVARRLGEALGIYGPEEAEEAGEETAEAFAKGVKSGASAVSGAAADLVSAAEDAFQQHLEKFKESLDAEYDAAEEMYDKRLDALKAEQEAEIKAFEKATEKKIDLIKKEYEAKGAYVDKQEEKYTSAIQAEIDALEAQTEAEERARSRKQAADKKASLAEKVLTARTAKERGKAQKEYNDYLAELKQKEQKDARQARIDELKEQKQRVKDSMDVLRDELKEQQETRVNALKEQRAAELEQLKKTQSDRLAQSKKYYNSELDELKKYHEKRLVEYEKQAQKENAIAAVSNAAQSAATAASKITYADGMASWNGKFGLPTVSDADIQKAIDGLQYTTSHAKTIQQIYAEQAAALDYYTQKENARAQSYITAGTAAKSETPIVINITDTLDGDVIGRRSYEYMQSRLRVTGALA